MIRHGLWATMGLLIALPVSAAQIPAGTEIEIRLKTKVSSAAAKSGDAVDAVVIAPVMVEKECAIPAGTAIHGQVADAVHPTAADQRAALTLKFTSMDGSVAPAKIETRVVRVDNAREKVDDQGHISGILASETMTGKLDSAISKVTDRYSGLGGFLGAVKGVVFNAADTAIVYDAGVEMTLVLTAPANVTAVKGADPREKLRPFDQPAALTKLVVGLPFRANAESPPKPSDLTNILLVGSRQQVEEVFEAAGWFTAAALSRVSKFETVKALAENRGYNEAPVSILLLDGRPPDIVFEKLNNTFARRHHLRVWLQPQTFGGQQVWAIAATHDTGISFSEENRTFIHRIDTQIDRERDKVVNDLLLTGKVVSLTMVDRPEVPAETENATGDKVVTDGRMAAILLQ